MYKFVYDKAKNIEEIMNDHAKKGWKVVSTAAVGGNFRDSSMFIYVTFEKK